MAEVALIAEVRRTQGSSSSRRLRTEGKIPGVIYGHGTEPTAVAIQSKALRQALNTDAGLNALIQLDVEGTKHLALPRDVQTHPVRNTVIHVDFQVVRRDEMMDVDVPIQFIGEADHVLKAGGLVEHLLQTLAVQATPGNIPSHIEVDISELQLDSSIRVKEIKLPANVTTQLDPDEPVVVGKPSRAALEADAADAGTPAAPGEAATPAAES